MKSLSIALVLATGVLVSACGSKGESDHAGSKEHDEHDDHEKGGKGDEHAEAAEPGVLKIDPDMVRDLRLTTAVAEQRTGGEGVTALGEVEMNQDAYAEVGSPVPARVTVVQAKIGDTVVAGQPLATLHSPDLGRARGELLAASARAAFAERTLARKKSLAAENLVPAKEVQEAEAELAAASAAQRAARAGSGGISGGGDARFVLRSPVAGTVIARDIVLGRMADPEKPLFRVGNLTKLWVIVHSFERDAVRIKVGSVARVSFPALPGQTIDGEVKLIGAEVDVASRTIPIRVEVPNADGVLRPGMSASAWLPIGDTATRIVAVPAASLQRMQDAWVVFVPRKDGAFEVRKVGRGRDLGGEVEILSGIAEGETVVVEGAFLLKAESEKARGEGGHHDHH